jgi:dTDP-4-amino-4,6-dideoxygalactose transaminase
MLVPFSSPLIEADEIREVTKVLRSGWIGTGPKVQEFERKLSEYIGVNNAITVNSCTAALHLSLIVSGVRVGDEVITTPMTFAATSNVITHVGAKPVFADIKKNSWNIDPNEIKKRITNRTKAIIPVHYAGLPCDLNEISEIARAKNIHIIEDAAHAFGARYDGQRIGSSGNLVCFSFYPTKNITTIEGGLVCTQDTHIADLIKVLRLHGQSSDAWSRYSSGSAKSYRVTHAGFKYNLTDVQAAIGIKQLEKVNRFLEIRKRIAKIYLEELNGVHGIIVPVSEAENGERVWHLFTILIKSEELGVDRDVVMAKLNEIGIGTGIHYEALNLHPFYQNQYGYHDGMYPVAEYVSARTLSLPLSAKLTDEQVIYVIDRLKSILKG